MGMVGVLLGGEWRGGTLATCLIGMVVATKEERLLPLGWEWKPPPSGRVEASEEVERDRQDKHSVMPKA